MATFAEQIAQETRAWARDGLISEQQAEAIRARYARGASSERRGRLITVLATIGVVAVGVGVILFFAANWDGIPKLGRLVLLLVGLAGTLAGGEALRGRYPRVGEAVTFLGGLLFGAAIFLVGQMYNVDDRHASAGFLLWTAGAVAGTAVFRTPRWAALAVGTFATWLGFVVGRVHYGEVVPFALALLGLAVYAVGTRIRESELLGLPRGLGLALASLPVFVLTFGDISDDAADHELPPRVIAACIATAVAAILAGGALALDRTRRTGIFEGGAVAVTAVALLLGTRVPLTPVAFNVLLVALALGAIWVGFENDEIWLVNVGIGLVAAEMIARFFDVFWHLLPRSAAFVVAGGLVLAVAWGLERQRSRLVARMTR
jgi:uncharacterized membrane protein